MHVSKSWWIFFLFDGSSFNGTDLKGKHVSFSCMSKLRNVFCFCYKATHGPCMPYQLVVCSKRRSMGHGKMPYQPLGPMDTETHLMGWVLMGPPNSREFRGEPIKFRPRSPHAALPIFSSTHAELGWAGWNWIGRLYSCCLHRGNSPCQDALLLGLLGR